MQNNNNSLEILHRFGWILAALATVWLWFSVRFHSPLCFWVGTIFIVVTGIYFTLLHWATQAARRMWVRELTGKDS